MLRIADKYKGQSMTILGIGCLDMDNIGQSMLKVLHSKFPNKFTEDVKPKPKSEKPKSEKGEGDI
tara:strand:- start:94 stop:288 length:195 start_codon:yes stop_codon:yes gene_type:complete